MSQSKVAIIWGETGVGKTTLQNLICETFMLTGQSRTSLTRDLHQFKINTLTGMLQIMDIPGTNSKEKALLHSIFQAEALKQEPLNGIFVCIKYSPRAENAFDEFERTAKPLLKFESIIVIIVTHWDHAKNDEKMTETQIRKDYIDTFNDQGQSNLIFKSQNIDHNSLEFSSLMHSKLPNNKTICTQTDNEFIQFFNIQSVDPKQKIRRRKIEQTAELILVEVRNKVDLEISKDNSCKEELVQTSISDSRILFDKLIQDFIDEFRSEMEMTDCYSCYIQMTKELDIKHKKYTHEILAKELKLDPNDKTDWRNLIKRCNHCQLIWLKVSGCDGNTTCGAIDKNPDKKQKPHRQYFGWDYVKNYLIYEYNHNFSQKYDPKQRDEKKGLGCGATINWSTLPPVREDELNNILTVKDLNCLIDNLNIYESNKGNFVDKINNMKKVENIIVNKDN